MELELKTLSEPNTSARAGRRSHAPAADQRRYVGFILSAHIFLRFFVEVFVDVGCSLCCSGRQRSLIILRSHGNILNLIFHLRRAGPSGHQSSLRLPSQFPCHVSPCILYVLESAQLTSNYLVMRAMIRAGLNIAQSRITSNSFNLSRSSPLSVAGTVTGKRVSGHRKIYKSGLLSSSSQQHLTPS